jgi:transposase
MMTAPRRRVTGGFDTHGVVDAVGVESTGSYGAGLARHLTAAGVKVVEVNRPEKLDRYLDGKDDFLDAESAAHDRVEAINQFKSMIYRSPNSFRDVFSTKSFHHQLNAAVRFRTSHADLVEQELRVALKLLAQRIRFLEGQINDIETRLRPIIAEHFLGLLGLHGVGQHQPFPTRSRRQPQREPGALPDRDRQNALRRHRHR